jgi:hypothetical protein
MMMSKFVEIFVRYQKWSRIIHFTLHVVFISPVTELLFCSQILVVDFYFVIAVCLGSWNSPGTDSPAFCGLSKNGTIFRVPLPLVFHF